MGDNMNFQRSSGILLHPTSLPSSFGIGDFGSNAYGFIDFLSQTGCTLWQVLPLGPTSFGDSPYQSFGAFAGNPLLISPGLLCRKGYLTQKELEEMPVFSNHKVDYSNVLLHKDNLLHIAFERFQEFTDLSEKQAFIKFKQDNTKWLLDFTLFVALKEYFIAKRKQEGYSKDWEAFAEQKKGDLDENVLKDYYFGAVWSTWPKELVQRKPEALLKWREILEKEIAYQEFLQFTFFEQWFALKQYANDKGIKIIGDIPIFVAYDSADAWACPQNFYMDEQGFPTVVAGVPPDYFSKTGQFWGNPLYDWEYHEKTGYHWWIDRIAATLETVDILRIDHFRAFKSYWSIPATHKDATGGKWKKGPGEKLFTAIRDALGELPIIAEDLGIITPEVTKLRESLGFPGMKVLQFAFADGSSNAYLPHNYEQNAVVYTGTHDNDTSLGWYQQATEFEQDHLRRYLNIDGKNISWDMIRLAISSTAQIAIFPLQDVLRFGSESRMNTPSTPSGNWQFRFTWENVQEDAAEALYYLNFLFNRLAPKLTDLEDDFTALS